MEELSQDILPPDLQKEVDRLRDNLKSILPKNPNIKTIVCPKCNGKECAYCYGCGIIEVDKNYRPTRIITDGL